MYEMVPWHHKNLGKSVSTSKGRGCALTCVVAYIRLRVCTSAGHLCWIYRQLIGMSYIALARQVQIYRIQSGDLDPDHFGT